MSTDKRQTSGPNGAVGPLDQDINSSGKKTTSRQGCELVYETFGEGTPVLMSHPLYTSRGLWSLFHFVELLSPRYQVIVYDSIGHGESEKPRSAERYTQSERAADAIAVLDALGIERAHGVGYSMGAWTMAAVAALHSDRLLSVTLGGWDPYKGAHAPKTETKQSVIDRNFEKSIGWFLSSPYTAGFLEGSDHDALRICHGVLFDAQVETQAIARCPVPKFVFCGDADAFFAGAEQLAREVRAEKFARYAGADHSSAIGLEEARTALAEFLASVDPSAARAT